MSGAWEYQGAHKLPAHHVTSEGTKKNQSDTSVRCDPHVIPTITSKEPFARSVLCKIARAQEMSPDFELRYAGVDCSTAILIDATKEADAVVFHILTYYTSLPGLLCGHISLLRLV